MLSRATAALSVACLLLRGAKALALLNLFPGVSRTTHIPHTTSVADVSTSQQGRALHTHHRIDLYACGWFHAAEVLVWQLLDHPLATPGGHVAAAASWVCHCMTGEVQLCV